MRAPQRTLVAVVVLFGAAATVLAHDWPHWRGPRRDDTIEEGSGWQDGRWMGEKPAWEAEVGGGSTSPLVAGGRLFVMGLEQGKDHVRCLDARTGKPLWTVFYKAPRYGRHATGDENAYAGPTSTPEYDPVTGFLYTLSCDGDLNCWNTAGGGKRVWGINLYDRFNIPQRPATKLEPNDLRDYGYTTAPFVYDEWVIIEVGAPDGTVMAFDKRTGEVRWASQYHGPAGHTGGLAQMVVDGVPSVAVLSYDDLVVVRLDHGNEGKTVATYPWKSAWANNVLTPAVDGDCVLISTKHTHNSICKIKVTLKGARRIWEQPHASYVGSPTVSGNHIYMAAERLVCLDAGTGKLVWEGGSFGNGGACVVTGDGKLIVWSDQGRLILAEDAEHSPHAYKQLARVAHVFEGGSAWPHVVLADGLLYCKDRAGHVKCFSTPQSTPGGG